MLKKLLHAGLALALTSGLALAAFNLGFDGKIISQGAGPAVSSCGTGAIATGSSDTAGQVTATGATGCVLTFSVAFATVPSCVTLNETLPSRAYTAVVTATTITLGSLTSGDKVSWICIAKAGG